MSKRLDARYDWLPSPDTLAKYGHLLVAFVGNACDADLFVNIVDGKLALVSMEGVQCSYFTKVSSSFFNSISRNPPCLQRAGNLTLVLLQSSFIYQGYTLFLIRRSNFEAETIVPGCSYFLWYRISEFRCSCLFLGEFTLLLFHGWEWQEDNSLTSTNFSLKLLYTYPLYLDKENVTQYKFMLLLRVFSSMQMNKNALSLGLRLGTFLACS